MDKFTGRAKGFAYLEFAAKVCPCSYPIRPQHVKDVFVRKKGRHKPALRPCELFSCMNAKQESVLTAMEKNNALLRDRPIKVINKRTNLPAWQVCSRAQDSI